MTDNSKMENSSKVIENKLVACVTTLKLSVTRLKSLVNLFLCMNDMILICTCSRYIFYLFSESYL